MGLQTKQKLEQQKDPLLPEQAPQMDRQTKQMAQQQMGLQLQFWQGGHLGVLVFDTPRQKPYDITNERVISVGPMIASCS